MTAFLTGWPELLLGPVLEGPQDHGRDFLRAILLVAQLDLHVLAHLALDRLDGALRGQHPLVAGRLADEQPAVLRQADERRQDRIAVLREDVRLAVADDGDFAVGRAQVDADDGFHDGSPLDRETVQVCLVLDPCRLVRQVKQFAG